MKVWGDIETRVKTFVFKYVNKELLTFLVFVAISYIFWLMMTLNENYEREITVPFTITGVPDNVVLLDDEAVNVGVTIDDKGWMLMGYRYGDMLKPVKVDFKTYRKGTSTISISSEEILRLVTQQLAASSKVTAINPEQVQYYYNYGTSKRVPVRYRGKVEPGGLSFVSKVLYSPDSVDVYTIEEKIDSINIIYTEVLNYTNFEDTLTITATLEQPVGVKCSPAQMELTFITDILTEATVADVPISAVNVPEGKSLRTFPSKVSVSFVAGMSVVKRLKASDFTVIVDYADIISGSERCRLYLTSYPSDITRVGLAFSQVDYLIEEL